MARRQRRPVSFEEELSACPITEPPVFYFKWNRGLRRYQPNFERTGLSETHTSLLDRLGIVMGRLNETVESYQKQMADDCLDIGWVMGHFVFFMLVIITAGFFSTRLVEELVLPESVSFPMYLFLMVCGEYLSMGLVLNLSNRYEDSRASRLREFKIAIRKLRFEAFGDAVVGMDIGAMTAILRISFKNVCDPPAPVPPADISAPEEASMQADHDPDVSILQPLIRVQELENTKGLCYLKWNKLTNDFWLQEETFVPDETQKVTIQNLYLEVELMHKIPYYSLPEPEGLPRTASFAFVVVIGCGTWINTALGENFFLYRDNYNLFAFYRVLSILFTLVSPWVALFAYVKHFPKPRRQRMEEILSTSGGLGPHVKLTLSPTANYIEVDYR